MSLRRVDTCCRLRAIDAMMLQEMCGAQRGAVRGEQARDDE